MHYLLAASCSGRLRKLRTRRGRPMSISPKVTRQLRERHLLLVVPADHVDAVAALREAYGEGNISVDVRVYVGRMPAAADLARSCERHDAVLLAGSARCAPSTVLPGPSEYAVPVGECLQHGPA